MFKGLKVDFKLSSIQRWQCPIHNGIKYEFGINVFWKLITSLHLSCMKIYRKYQREKTLVNCVNNQYLPHYWSNKCFKGTVVNRALHLWNYPFLGIIDALRVPPSCTGETDDVWEWTAVRQIQVDYILKRGGSRLLIVIVV